MKSLKIYLAHNRAFDYQTLFYTPLQQALLAHELIMPHPNGAEASFDSREVIPTCHFLIAEVSYPSTGLGMELAWADTAKIPILCLHQENTKPSSSIYHLCNNVKPYHDLRHLQEITIQTFSARSSFSTL